jgi:hypothetical protein
MDALDCIKKYANARSLIYCDPPYVSGTRVAPKTYKHEYTDDQHRQLVEVLLDVPGSKILSGYESPIYQPLLDAGWELLTKQICCHASGKSKKTYRTECLYCSPVSYSLATNDNTCRIHINNKGAKKMKHPLDRKVFFTRQRNDFLSLNEIRTLTRACKLSMMDLVFDTDGCSYTIESIAFGRAPKWAVTAENDPMLHDLPPLSDEEAAMVEELLLEEDFIEMPAEPKAKTVADYLSREPRIARMVVDAGHWMF